MSSEFNSKNYKFHIQKNKIKIPKSFLKENFRVTILYP